MSADRINGNPNTPEEMSGRENGGFMLPPERMEYLHAPYSPEQGEGFLERIYRAGSRERVPDERKEQNARRWSRFGKGLHIVNGMLHPGKSGTVSNNSIPTAGQILNNARNFKELYRIKKEQEKGTGDHFLTGLKEPERQTGVPASGAEKTEGAPQQRRAEKIKIEWV